MLLSPELDPLLCPNYQTCKQASRSNPDAEFELLETVGTVLTRHSYTRRTAASSMLLRRGCPQTPQSLGFSRLIADLAEQIAELESRITSQFSSDCYIAPTESTVHFYQVKRGDRHYTYYKLCAKKAIFAPARESGNVKNIHLPHWNDSRCQEGLSGVGKRNQLMQVKEKLQSAKSTLDEVLLALSRPASDYWEADIDDSVTQTQNRQTIDEASLPDQAVDLENS
jgi:hypothetical protein